MKASVRVIAVGLLCGFLNIFAAWSQDWSGVNVATDLYQDCLRPVSVGAYDMVANKTFITFMGSDGRPNVASIDHTTGAVSEAVPFGSISAYDAHDYPQMVQSPDGYLHVFYANQLGSDMRYARSKYPHSCDEWVDQSTGLRSEYPMPMISDNGTIYFFNRWILKTCKDAPCEGTYRHPQFIKSIDGGVTWSQRQVIMERWNQSDNLNEMYIGQIVKEPRRDGVPERFHFVWILAGGTIHDQVHKNIYHAYFQPVDEHFYTMDGADLGVTIDEAEMENHCLVVNTGPAVDKLHPNYINFVAIDDQGIPIINDSYRWNGSGWQKFTPVNVPEFSYMEWREGKFFAYAGPSVYQSTDKGVTWTKLATMQLPIIHTGVSKQTMPIANPSHPDARIWMKEQNNNSVSGVVSVGGPGQTENASKITIMTNPGYLQTENVCEVYAFICDKGGARIMSASNTVNFSLDGPGELDPDAIVEAVSGLATIKFKAPAEAGSTIIVATSDGLVTGKYIILYDENGNVTDLIVDEGSGEDTTELPTGIYSVKSSNEVQLRNYPNPVSTMTTFSFNLKNQASVSLVLYNMLGEEITMVMNSRLSAGTHTYQFNASGLNAGMYIYRLSVDGSIYTSKMNVF